MSYAIKTSVPVDRSQGEIRKTLSRYEATGFAYGEQGHVALVMFEMKGRRIKFVLPLPVKPAPRSSAREFNQYEQTIRTRWRCLALAIKAKLECVETGITTLEQEFLAHVMLPSGQTAGEVMIPQIEKSYQTGKMPPLLGHQV
jgi:hypothetical protein